MGHGFITYAGKWAAVDFPLPGAQTNVKLLDGSGSAPMEVPRIRLALDDVLSGKQAPTRAAQKGDWQIQ
jgi:hypothetical protein